MGEDLLVRIVVSASEFSLECGDYAETCISTNEKQDTAEALYADIPSNDKLVIAIYSAPTDIFGCVSRYCDISLFSEVVQV